MYEIFEHTADLGLRMQAATLEGVFTDAARGLTSLFLAEGAVVAGDEERTIEIPGTSRELSFLLFDWLTEVLYAFASDRFVAAEFHVRLHPDRLIALCRGQRLDPAQHPLDHEVKAITYHGLRVEETSAAEWFAEVIVDI